MLRFIQGFHPVVFLIVATVLEVSGDAVIRMCMYNHTGTARIFWGLGGIVLLGGYGFFLNLTPVEFSQVVGLYIATLFVVWQIINYIAFRILPTLPIMLGGLLIVVGGLIVTFWKAK